MTSGGRARNIEAELIAPAIIELRRFRAPRRNATRHRSQSGAGLETHRPLTKSFPRVLLERLQNGVCRNAPPLRGSD
jgi:hypothetical protein